MLMELGTSHLPRVLDSQLSRLSHERLKFQTPRRVSASHSQFKGDGFGVRATLEGGSEYVDSVLSLTEKYRYWTKSNELGFHMNKFVLRRYQVLVEVKWLLKLSHIPELEEVPNLSEDAQSYLEGIVDGFNMNHFMEIEDHRNQDIDPVAYFLKQTCKTHPEISKVLEFFHFACKFTDINNLAQALLLKETLTNAIYPVMDEMIEAMYQLSIDNASLPMISHSNGLTASPTTLGKELANFVVRLSREKHIISQVKIMGQFGGYDGNFCPHRVAYPNTSWPQIGEEFVTSLGLTFDPTASMTCDSVAALANAFIGFNKILADFGRHMCDFILLGYCNDSVTPSTSLKLNPSDFATSNENISVACLNLTYFSKSNFNLSWAFGTFFGTMAVALEHCLCAYKSTIKGMAKLQINEARMSEDLNYYWEVNVGALQIIMQKYDVPKHHVVKLKELIRERQVTKESMRELIKGLEIPEESKTILTKLTPHTYIGAAVKLAETVDMAVRATRENTNGSAEKVNIVSDISSTEFGRLNFVTLLGLEGQYWGEAIDLAPYMSEYGLIYFLVLVEIKWLLWLSQIPEVTQIPSFSESAKSYLQEVIDGFSINDALEIKKIEKVNDAVESVKCYLQQRCLSHPELAEVCESFHFACTSEDINNLAHGLMLKAAMDNVILPVMDDLLQAMCTVAKDNAHIPMVVSLKPSVTTFGKQIANFAVRLNRKKKDISCVKIMCKFGGPLGIYNAHLVAYPGIDWPQVSEDFITSLGLGFDPYASQIELHDYMEGTFHAISQFNDTLMEFDKMLKGNSRFLNSVGTPPHAVGTYENLVLANDSLCPATALMAHMSPWHFESTYSSVRMIMRLGLCHSIKAYKSSLLVVLERKVYEEILAEVQDHHWEFLLEAVHMIMVRHGHEDPASATKVKPSSGETWKECVRDFIRSSNLPEEAKTLLLQLAPGSYRGSAMELVDMLVDLVQN